MADKDDKNIECVEGRYYTDNQCIGCDACCNIAPEFFVLNDDYLSVVVKQPTNSIEEALCDEALNSCPVDAIGDDGDI